MNDTPQNIKELQRKIWLSKPPMERLRQMMENNAALYKFWKEVKRSSDSQRPIANTATEDRL
jgi:hypothetical protein